MLRWWHADVARGRVRNDHHGCCGTRGCSTPATESRLDEYEDRAEQIRAGKLERVPGNEASEVRMTSQPQFGEPKVRVGPERDISFWTIWSTVEVSTDATPAEASEAAGTSLLDQQWKAEPTVDQGGTVPYVTTYRLAEPDGEWIVLISWPAGDGDHRISLLAQNSITVSGATSRPGRCPSRPSSSLALETQDRPGPNVQRRVAACFSGASAGKRVTRFLRGG